MRADPERLRFEITARDGAARAGLLHTPHGAVETPGLRPARHPGQRSRRCTSSEVAGLGYEMVLGNTFHLLLSARAGADRASSGACTSSWAGSGRSSPTRAASRSSRSPTATVADEIKGRRGAAREGRVRLEIDEEGVRFRSYLDGSERFIGPETSMEVQAALGSDIALAFDECTPFHADRDYTARSTERTHRWLDRCLDWHERTGPRGQAVFGIVQGGVHEDLRAALGRARRPRPASTGIAIGGTLGRDKEQMREVVGVTAPLLPTEAPRHLLGIGERRRPGRRDRARHRHLRLRRPDAPRPPRHGARPRCPERALPARPPQRRYARTTATARGGLPLPGVRACTRAPTSTTSSRAEELTGVRLLTLHNLTYLERLVAGARAAIEAGAFAALSARQILGGAPPWG